MSTPPPRSRRPLLIAIAAVIMGLFGLLVIINGILLILGHPSLTDLGFPGGFFGLGGLIGGVIGLILGFIAVAIAWALWRLKFWAWVLSFLVVLYEVIVFAAAGDFVSIGFALFVIILVYLIVVARYFV